MQKLQELSINEVSLADAFWAPRIKTNREVTLPIEYQLCKSTGRIDAPSWKPGQDNEPHFFWDSDVAKWVEAAAYSLEANPDAELEALVDDYIAQISACQGEDGYFNSYFQNVKPEARWINLRENHELYCAGHLFEAAVAYYEGTGKRTLLDCMCRYADYIGQVFGRGEGQLRGYPGHEEIELGLVRLADCTGESKYLELARYFVEERGQQPDYFAEEAKRRGEEGRPYGNSESYWQEVPVRERESIEGHAVRALYFCSGLADVAVRVQDDGLLEACRKMWRSIAERRMYITGGTGSSMHGERFTVDYDLSNEYAYSETCAAIALVFFAKRMLEIEKDGQYADVMERALYNNVLSGVSEDGRHFFYANPLAVYPKAYGFGMNRFPAERQEWFGCSCCPPNVARMLSSLQKYVYSRGPDELWVHLFITGSARFEAAGQTVELSQSSGYPWDGDIEFELDMDASARFDLCVRIPGWCRNPSLTVNGEPEDLSGRIERGYVRLSRTWNKGDEVRLNLPLPVEVVGAHPKVRQDAGRIALQRGPIVYCLEQVDNGEDLNDLLVDRAQTFEVGSTGGIFNGVPVIRGVATRTAPEAWEGVLYQPLGEQAVQRQSTEITAVPYCLWANRQVGEMLVWLRSC